jgi:ribonuclease VapC
MIVDTSALVAIALDEPERLKFQELIVDSTTARLSAANLVELFIVVDRHANRSVSDRIDTLLGALALVIEPVTAEQARIAREAYRLFGRGNGHPARLNYGDCFAYALAKALSEPLLFKGDDFIHTDVAAAAIRG